MTHFPDKDELAEGFLRCKRCGSCREVCPVFDATILETYSPRGIVALAEAYLAGELPASAAKDALYACTLCLACRDECSNAVPIDGVILSARAALAGEIGTPRSLRFALWLLGRPSLPAPLKRLALTLASNVGRGSLPKMPPASFRRGPEAYGPQDGRPVQFFVGCLLNHIYPGAAVAVARTLAAAGLRVEIPSGQGCCGAPCFSWGAVCDGAEWAAANAAALDGTSPVVAACAAGGLTLGETYAGLGDKEAGLSARVTSYSQLLLENVQKLRGEMPGEVTVTWHDPCSLRRGRGVWREPREILRQLPGVRFVEMENADTCCGGEALSPFRMTDVLDRMGRAKAAAIVKSGAEVVATECPSCMMRLEAALWRAGSRAQVVHLAELVEMTIPPGSGG